MLTLIKIIKKDGEKELFDPEKIKKSLVLAHENSNEIGFNPENILGFIENYLEIFAGTEQKFSTTQLRALTVKILEQNGFIKTAEKYNEFQNILNNKNGTFDKDEESKLKNLYDPDCADLNECIERMVADCENPELKQNILELIKNRQMFPGMNILKKNLPFDEEVIVTEDSLDDIFESLKKMAINYQNGISTTLNFSKIRSKSAVINSSKGQASGPVAFAKIFISTLSTLKNGQTRFFNTEQKIVLSINHPDLLEFLVFIKSQTQNTKRDFKFFVDINSEFLSAVSQDQNYELLNPQTGLAVNLQNAKSTLDLIFSTLKENPNFGLLLPQFHQNWHQNKRIISATINLSEFVENGEFNSKKFTDCLNQTEKFLQVIINKNDNLKNTQIRINFTGLIELLIKLNISYTSLKSLELSANILALIKESLSAGTQSAALHQTSLDKVLNLSGGIEALSVLVSSKTNIDGEKVFHLSSLFKKVATDIAANIVTNHEILTDIEKQNSIQNFDLHELNQIKAFFLTRNDVWPEWSLKMQQLFEENLDYTDKAHLLPAGYDLESIALENFQKMDNLQFSSIEKNLYQKNHEANFLIKTPSGDRRRNSIQIQPPLFQVKRTEEIKLPPIAVSE